MNIIRSKDHRTGTYETNKILLTKYIFKTMDMMD